MEIKAACCLRSKLYALLYENELQMIKMKVTKKNILKEKWSLMFFNMDSMLQGQPSSSIAQNKIRFDTFTSLLAQKKKKISKFYRIRSKNYQVSKFLQRKATFVSPFDDKRWLFNCMLHSLPYGSVYAKKENTKNCPFCKKNFK